MSEPIPLAILESQYQCICQIHWSYIGPTLVYEPVLLAIVVKIQLIIHPSHNVFIAIAPIVGIQLTTHPSHNVFIATTGVDMVVIVFIPMTLVALRYSWSPTQP